MRLEKINKRMCVVDDSGKIAYTPPDFIRHKVKGGRQAYDDLVEAMIASDNPIDAILAFETKHHAPKAPK